MSGLYSKRTFSRMVHTGFLLGLFLALTAPIPARALEQGEDQEAYEPPPEGYEERTYDLTTLLSATTDFKEGSLTAACSPFACAAQPVLSGQDVMDVIKICVEPESWGRRGPARMSVDERKSLVVLQKKEAQAEIVKVLQWIRLGIVAPFRATIVVAALKPEVLKQAAEGAGTLTPDELMKALDAAGEAARAEVIELVGREGQSVISSGREKRGYIRDYDVSGAVLDPVMGVVETGLRAQAVGFRAPDCKNVHLDLAIQLDRDLTMEQAQLGVDGVMIGQTVMQEGADEGEEKKDDKKEAPRVQHAANARLKKSFKLDLPRRTTGGLHASLTVPQGVFALAGTLDLGMVNGGKAGERLAVFVRAAVGNGQIPVLQGVSGLKEGESFKLYPLLAGLRTVADYPGPDFSIAGPEDQSGQAGGAANPFVAAPPAALVTSAMAKAKLMFVEKVRKNKIVEFLGPLAFTRLKEDDHQKFLHAQMEALRRNAPMRVRAVALAVAPESARKILLKEDGTWDAAALQALAAEPATQVLADTALSLAAGQRSHVFAGREKAAITDYEISGDAYDPVVHESLEHGYVLDLKAQFSGEPQVADVELRFLAVPGEVTAERRVLDSLSVNTGANVDMVLGIKADLDVLKRGLVTVKGNVSVVPGSFAFAGAAHMPALPDGKPDPRQAVVFLTVTPPAP